MFREFLIDRHVFGVPGSTSGSYLIKLVLYTYRYVSTKNPFVKVEGRRPGPKFIMCLNGSNTSH